MTRNELLRQIKARLTRRHRHRLRGVILYGSVARGDAEPDSDVDVLVLLDGPVDYGRDLQENLEALYPLALEIGRRISAKPVEASQYETIECPRYQTVHREGLAG